MELLSTLADIGFVAPLLATALLVMLARRDYAAALRWGGAFLLAVLATGVLKGVFRGSAELPHFPSGHVSVAVSFYGGLLAILWGGRLRLLPYLLVLAVVAGLAGWSRVELTSHTWTDVLGGFAVGALSLLILGCSRGAARVGVQSRIWLMCGVVLALPAGLSLYSWLGYSIRTMVE